MKDTARRRARSQETTTEQLVFAAMRDARATLHDAVVAAGMGVLSAMLEEDRSRLCGPRYAHDPRRRASRAGHAEGELAMGGRRVRMQRPRVRGADGREVPLETWERFAEADPLTPRAVEQMVLGGKRRAPPSGPAPFRDRSRAGLAPRRRAPA
jgi:putative transposase